MVTAVLVLGSLLPIYFLEKSSTSDAEPIAVTGAEWMIALLSVPVVLVFAFVCSYLVLRLRRD